MILIKYELVSQAKKHHWSSGQVAKFQWVWSILIFNGSVWNNCIFKCHTNMPKKWAKIEKFEKFIKNDKFLHVKRLLLSFAQLSRVLLKIQDSAWKLTRLNVVFYDPTSTNFFTIIFFCLEVNQQKIPTKWKFTSTREKKLL